MNRAADIGSDTAGVEWVDRPDDDQPTTEDVVEPEPVEIKVGQRVTHRDYGRGTVVSIGERDMEVQWDKPFLRGTTRRIYDHDPSFARQLAPLVDDADGRESPAL